LPYKASYYLTSRAICPYQRAAKISDVSLSALFSCFIANPFLAVCQIMQPFFIPNYFASAAYMQPDFSQKFQSKLSVSVAAQV
jgi:hypothetical protein